jgi:hypothetical protein
LFHPFALAAGARDAAIAGAVRSMRTVSDFDASTLPATSVAKYDSVLSPSPVTVTGATAAAALPIAVCWPMLTE